MKNQENICMISVWFGPWPAYLDFFLKTCTANHSIDWIIISDQHRPDTSAGNIAFRKLSVMEFADAASEKLGFEISIQDPYKLCDFKPALGYIFEDMLTTYQYWGYCDMDIIFGEILEHIRPSIEEKPDIISGYPDFLSGPFCLYRNAPAVNSLFKNGVDYRSVLQDPSHMAFDENIPKKLTFVRKNLYRLQYILQVIFVGPRYHFRFREIRYHFQWYAKRRMSYHSQPRDMTECILKASNEKIIRSEFRDLIQSDRAWTRQGRKRWTISWEDGKLIDLSNGKDLFAFHFVDAKYNPGFVNKTAAGSGEKFAISEEKIEYK